MQAWVYGHVFKPEDYLAWNGALTLKLLACVIGIALVSYFLGSVNSAIILTKVVYGEDIRQKGSGNPGMTNVMRTYGWLPALITLIGDMLKCMLSMYLGVVLWGMNGAYLAGFFCIIGHIAPVLYKFKGGKGVASAFMFILCIDVWAFIMLGLTFILLVWVTRYLSLGSVVTAMVMPLMLHRMMERFTQIEVQNLSFLRLMLALIIGGIIVYKHRANILRIRDKTESRFSFKKTVRKEDLVEAEKSAELPGEAEEEDSEEVRARKEMNRKKSAKKKK